MSIEPLTDKLAPGNGASLAVELLGVSKNLRGRPILQNVNLAIAVGETIGIYGPNGSGKSMLLRIISGLVRVSNGMVRVFGQVVGRDIEFPQGLGALIDGPGFALDMSGVRNLELLGAIRGQITRADIDAALERVGLDSGDQRAVKTYSTGMRQRLGIAQAIMEKPRLLLLDEPTSALDPDSAEQVHALLEELKTQGCTLVIVSHSQAEIARLCERTFRMQGGVLRPDKEDSERPKGS